METLRRLTRRAFVVAGTAVCLTTTAAAEGKVDFPTQPIRIIIPTDPGGAMDGLARAFQRAFEETKALSQKVVIVNMAGAGGTVGTRAIKDAEPDGHTIGFWHDGLVTSKAMGIVDFDHTAFEIIGATGFAKIGLAVSKEGRFKSFKEMIAFARANPGKVTSAVNIGLPVHFIPMQVGVAAGVEFRFVQVGGGARRYQSLLGGHTDFAMFSLQELVQFESSGLRSIVMLAEERVAQLPDVPTGRELGVDVAAISARIWLAPKGTPPQRSKVIRDAFRTAVKNEKVARQLIGFGLEPTFIEPEMVVTQLDNALKDTLPLVSKARQVQR